MTALLAPPARRVDRRRGGPPPRLGARRPRPAPAGARPATRRRPRTWRRSCARPGSTRSSCRRSSGTASAARTSSATLRAPGDEFVVIGAHHDTAPEAPGAYDDGGGVGILIELAPRARARRAAAADDRVRLVRRRGGRVDGEGHDRGLAGLRRAARAAGPGADRRVRDRDVGLEGRDARPPPDRLRGPAREGPRGDRPGVARARGARRARARRALRSASATPGCRGSTSRRCGRSACGSTATTCPSCRRATRRSSPRTRPSPPSIPTTTSPRTPRTSSTRRRSSGWGEASSASCARSSACRAARPRSRTGSRPSAASSAGRGSSASARRACCPGCGAGWRAGGLALGARVVQALLAGVLLWLPPGAGALAPARPASAAAVAPVAGGRSLLALAPRSSACWRSAPRRGGAGP